MSAAATTVEPSVTATRPTSRRASICALCEEAMWSTMDTSPFCGGMCRIERFLDITASHYLKDPQTDEKNCVLQTKYLNYNDK